MDFRVKVFLVALILLFATTQLFAEETIFSTTDENNNTIVCRHVSENDTIHAGRLKSNGRFAAYADLMKTQKRKLRKLRSQRASLELITRTKRKIRKLKQLHEQQTPLCESAYDGAPEDPSPSPTPTPPEECNGSFDDLGNTCPDKFQIPAQLTGNITRGSQIQTLRCTGCHIERTNYQYNAVWTAVHTVPNMNGVLNGYELDQAIADLVAYFNRFN